MDHLDASSRCTNEHGLSLISSVSYWTRVVQTTLSVPFSRTSRLSLDDSVFSQRNRRLLVASSTPPRRLRDESTMISPHLSPSARRLFAEIDDFRFRNREWFDSDLRQAQLKPDTVPKLHEALPALTDSFIGAMMSPLWRSYDPNLIQEPTVYRFFYSFFICHKVY